VRAIAATAATIAGRMSFRMAAGSGSRRGAPSAESPNPDP
jgi:hypothetical protein